MFWGIKQGLDALMAMGAGGMLPDSGFMSQPVAVGTL
jgi:hypothetical protein